MTKLGTPIGAGPKGANVVVGLAGVGVPPAEYWEPPSPPFGQRLVAAAGGARRVDAAAARRRRWRRRGLVAGDAVACGRCAAVDRRRPARRRPCSGGLAPARARGAVGAGTGVAGSAAPATAPRWCRSGGSQSGSVHVDEAVAVVVEPVGAGRRLQRGDGRVVVVAGSVTSLRTAGRRRRSRRPARLTTRKLARATISAILVLIPIASLPCPIARITPPCGRLAQATHSHGGPQRPRRPPTRP